MSRILEIPDSLYSALEQAARARGMTPVDWITANLGQTLADRLTTSDKPDSPRTLADLLSGRVGRISSRENEPSVENGAGGFGEYLEAKKRAGRL